MADPLSLLASSVAVVQKWMVVAETIKAVKQAPKDFVALVPQITLHVHSMQALMDVFRDQGATFNPTLSTGMASVLTESMSTAEAIERVISPLRDDGATSYKSRLKFSVLSGQLKDATSRITALNSTLQLLLTSVQYERLTQLRDSHPAFRPRPYSHLSIRQSSSSGFEQEFDSQTVVEPAGYQQDFRYTIRQRIEAFANGLKQRERAWFEKVNFEENRNYLATFTQLADQLESDGMRTPSSPSPEAASNTLVAQTTDQSQSVSAPDRQLRSSAVQLMESAHDLKVWLDERCAAMPSPVGRQLVTLNLVICGGISKHTQPSATGGIPFLKGQFVDVMTRLHLPVGFLELYSSGTAKLLIQNMGNSKHARLAFSFRTPLASSQDWTLSVSHDAKNQRIHAFLHGIQEHERDDFMGSIAEALLDICNPMLIPVILCEMLTTADANGIRSNAIELSKVEMKTNFSGVFTRFKASDLRAEQTPEQEFADLTQKLNYILSRFAFHEMRMHANKALMGQVEELLSEIEGHPDTGSSDNIADNEAQSNEALKKSSERLRVRIRQLESEHAALLLEISCNSKIASSQLQIVYNLIAQRDNKDNLQMAEISTRIANTTKDDSFAMRTLAIMSILFLPGTFMASFFSMNMFNWQAAPGEPIVASHFWVYWVVTGPLTLTVVTLWLVWLRTHNQRERFPFEERLASISPNVSLNEVKFHNKKTQWAVLEKWRKVKDKEEDEVVDDVEVAAGEATTTAIESDQSRGVNEELRRVNTIVQGPRR